MTSETIKRSATDAADRVAGAAGSAGEQASGLAKGGLSKAADAAGDLYGSGKDYARDAVAAIPFTASDAAASAEQMVLRGRQRLDHGVRKQPIEALMLAGAIGYLVGWATSR